VWHLALLLWGRSNDITLRQKYRGQNKACEFGSGVRLRLKLNDEGRLRAAVGGVLLF
jgi:hypothetical protein